MKKKPAPKLRQEVMRLYMDKHATDEWGIKHGGKSPHCWGDNELEEEFATAWARENGRVHPFASRKLLRYLMGDGREPAEITQAEATAVATTIQWLGSPVGKRFLEEVLDTDAGREFLGRFKR